MRTIFRIYLVMLVSIFTMVSCEKENEVTVKLPAPELSLKEKSSDSFTICWSPVKNAHAYMYNFGNNEDMTNDTILAFTGLKSDTTYTVKVKSVSEDASANSDWSTINIVLTKEEDPEEPGDPEEPEQNFNLTYTLDELLLTVRTEPTDKESPYFFEIITQSILDEAAGDPKTAYTTMLDIYTLYYGAETFNNLNITGDCEKAYNLERFGTKYYIIIAGIDENLNITTEVEIYSVETESKPASDNTFEVNDLEITQTSISMEIIPSNDDPYTYALIDTKTIDNMDSQQLYDFVLSTFSDENISNVYNGYRTVMYSKGLKPSSKYTLLVFGWNSMPTTAIKRHDVTTLDATIEENITFELEAEIQSSSKIWASVKPSDKQAYYFFNIITKEDYEKYKDDLTMHVKDVCDRMGVTVEDYFDMFSSVGDAEEVFRELSPETEYIFYAAALNIKDGEYKFFEPQIYDQPLITPAK